MPNIKARVGAANVVRVLSNAASPPSKLTDLGDVNTSRIGEDGMILVWDLATETFYMTDIIDSSNLTVTGIATFSNTAQSNSITTGALVVNGGLGVAKQVNIGEGITIAGIATFSSNLDINAAVDILNSLVVNSTFKSVGVTTLASSGGITTTGGDLYVGGDLFVADDIVYDEATARNWNVSGIATVGTLLDVNGNVDVDGRTELDTTNIAETLNVVGVTTLASSGGITTTGGDLYVGGDLYIADDLFFDEFTA